jgi:hypothetical protein
MVPLISTRLFEFRRAASTFIALATLEDVSEVVKLGGCLRARLG